MLSIQNVKNLKWVNAENTVFDCVVKFKEFEEELPFACDSMDIYEHSKEIWRRGLAGEFGVIEEFVALEDIPQPTVVGAQTL